MIGYWSVQSLKMGPHAILTTLLVRHALTGLSTIFLSTVITNMQTLLLAFV